MTTDRASRRDGRLARSGLALETSVDRTNLWASRSVHYCRFSQRETGSRGENADVAQLVAHHLAKVRVAGSNPVIRSKVQLGIKPTVEWPSGEATACKAVHTGSIPVSTSDVHPARLAQRESASLTRKRSLVQSQYRAPQYCLIGAFLVAWKLPPWAQKGQKDSRSAMLAVAELHQLAQHLFTPGSPTRKGS